MTDYFVTFAYLLLFFGSFAWYQRLILGAYQITFLHYGMAIIQALVLAKVVLIGRALNVSFGLFKDRPLIVPTLYKAFVFTVFVALFALIEKTVGGLLHGEGFAGGVEELQKMGRNELLARSLVVFTAFLPFFAFEELERVLGEGKLRRLLFRGRSAEPSSGKDDLDQTR